MPYYTPETKTELAFERLIDQLRGLDLEGVQILKRLDATRESLPLIRIVARTSRDADDAGDQLTDDTIVGLALRVESHYKAATEHDRICGVLRDWLRYGVDGRDIPDLLNEVMQGEQFEAIKYTRGDTENSTDGKRHVTEINGDLWMVPALEGN